MYLDSKDVRLGSLSLGRSARNMLRVQSKFGRRQRLSLAGWSNMSNPDRCAYDTCLDFDPDKVTSYIWAMGLDVDRQARRSLLAFVDAGADAPLDTGRVEHELGLRDSINQRTGELGLYLYLDTGWSVLGMLDYCDGGIVRRQFGKHAVARAGFRALRSRSPACRN